MSLKSVFTKLKSKKKPEVKTKESTQKKPETPPEPCEPTPPIKEKQEPQPVKEYHETIYTNGHTPKEKKPKTPLIQETQWKPKHWEGINTIEKNVDIIHTETQYQKTTSCITDDSDIERKVDLLLRKNKNKI